MEYDYRTSVFEDVKNVIESDYSDEFNDMMQGKLDRQKFEDTLNDDLFTNDSVTGNASGSYTFNTWDAEEYLCHNLDLLEEAIENFGGDFDIIKQGAESCDVTIRCYLLNESITKAIDELISEYEFNIDYYIKYNNGDCYKVDDVEYFNDDEIIYISDEGMASLIDYRNDNIDYWDESIVDESLGYTKKTLADILDENSLPSDDESVYRLFSLFDGKNPEEYLEQFKNN